MGLVVRVAGCGFRVGYVGVDRIAMTSSVRDCEGLSRKNSRSIACCELCATFRAQPARKRKNPKQLHGTQVGTQAGFRGFGRVFPGPGIQVPTEA